MTFSSPKPMCTEITTKHHTFFQKPQTANIYINTNNNKINPKLVECAWFWSSTFCMGLNPSHRGRRTCVSTTVKTLSYGVYLRKKGGGRRGEVYMLLLCIATTWLYGGCQTCAACFLALHIYELPKKKAYFFIGLCVCACVWVRVFCV